MSIFCAEADATTDVCLKKDRNDETFIISALSCQMLIVVSVPPITVRQLKFY